MNATPATKAAAQATVRDKPANEARISGVPFFFRAISSAMTTDTPPNAISMPNSTDFQNIFPAGEIDQHFPVASHPKTLVKKGFFTFYAGFSGSSVS
jgi:hypothetical protein